LRWTRGAFSILSVEMPLRAHKAPTDRVILREVVSLQLPSSARRRAEGEERSRRRERRADDSRGGTSATAPLHQSQERDRRVERLRQGVQRRHPAQPRAIVARVPEHHAQHELADPQQASHISRRLGVRSWCRDGPDRRSGRDSRESARSHAFDRQCLRRKFESVLHNRIIAKGSGKVAARSLLARLSA
jgi:hypothetical protein